VQREWEFATEELARITRNALLVRYPSVRLVASTAFFSQRHPQEEEWYRARLRWLTEARQQETSVLCSLE
jgi:hypothetical protein